MAVHFRNSTTQRSKHSKQIDKTFFKQEKIYLRAHYLDAMIAGTGTSLGPNASE